MAFNEEKYNKSKVVGSVKRVLLPGEKTRTSVNIENELIEMAKERGYNISFMVNKMLRELL